VIGAGFGGIGAGIKLPDAGIRDFAILERAGAVGGTREPHRPDAHGARDQ
jgi:cation diffusion facilitator CzcD-associated flavoprotein CzcO